MIAVIVNAIEMEFFLIEEGVGSRFENCLVIIGDVDFSIFDLFFVVFC